MITVNGRILENIYTTAQWAAITTPLPDRVWGHEVDVDGNPIGSKMGDGIQLWGALDYWYGAAGTQIQQAIPSGINYTYAYDGRFGDNPTAYVQQQISGGWQNTSAMVNIMNSGDIEAIGDFTDYSGEVYRLVVKG